MAYSFRLQPSDFRLPIWPWAFALLRTVRGWQEGDNNLHYGGADCTTEAPRHGGRTETSGYPCVPAAPGWLISPFQFVFFVFFVAKLSPAAHDGRVASKCTVVDNNIYK